MGLFDPPKGQTVRGLFDAPKGIPSPALNFDLPPRSAPLPERVAALEGIAAQTGAQPPEQDKPGLFTNFLNFISRPNFAAAGFVEELAEGEGFGSAMGRAAKELFSGLFVIPEFGGGPERRAFGEVFERIGFGTGPTLSSVMPFLFNETGEGVKFKRGGVADITTRGTLGLAADIFADPLTYVFSPSKAFQVVSKTGKAFAVNKATRKKIARTLDGIMGDTSKGIDFKRLGQLAKGPNAEVARLADELGVSAADITKAADSALTARRLAQNIEKKFKRPLSLKEGRQTIRGEHVTRDAQEDLLRSVEAHAQNINKTTSAPLSVSRQTAADMVAEGRAEMLLRDSIAGLIESGSGARYLENRAIVWGPFTIARSETISSLNSGMHKWATKAIAPLPGGAKTIESVTLFKQRVTDTMGKIFNVAWEARALKGFVRSRNAFLSTLGMNQARMGDIIAENMLDFERRGEKIHRKAVIAYERGGVRGVRAAFADNPKLAEEAGKAFEFYQRTAASMLEAEKRAGINFKSKIRKDADGNILYFMHSYRNTRAEIERFRGADSGSMKISKTELGKNGEMRAFELLEEADGAIIPGTRRKGLRGFESTPTTLKPEWSPMKSLMQRAENSIETISWRGYMADLLNKWGDDALGGLSPNHLFELNAANKLSTPVEKLIKQRKGIKAGGNFTDFDNGAERALRKMSDEDKRLFLEQRLLAAESREELIHVIQKYTPAGGKASDVDYTDFFPNRRLVEGTDDVLDILGEGVDDIAVQGYQNVSLPKPIAAAVSEIDARLFNAPEFKGMLKFYDKITNAFKTGVTVIFPAFHIRNAYSNVAQSFVDIGVGALNPFSHVKAVRVLMGGDEVIELGGRKYNAATLRDHFKRTGILQERNAYMEYTGSRAGAFTRWGAKVNRLRSKMEKGGALRYSSAQFLTPRGAGSFIESEARVQLAIQHMARGASLDEATERVNKFLFDYANGLTRTEREVFKRIIPFYTWQSKNMRLMYNNLKRNPAKLAIETKPFRGRAGENEQMTSWEAGALKLRINGDGKTVNMITGVDLPIRNLDMIWRGSVKRTTQQLLGTVSPLIKGPFEAATGVNLFLGRNMKRKEAAAIGRLIEQAPKPIRNALGWKKETDAAGRERHTFDGNRFYLLFQSWMMSRVVSTSDRVWKNYIEGDASWGRALLDFGTGLRAKEMNMNEEQEKMMFERLRQLEDSLVRRGVLAEGAFTFQPKTVRGEEIVERDL